MVSGWAFFRLSNIHLYFHFRTINECQWIFTKLSMCINIVESGMGLLMGEIRQFLTELPAHNMSDFFLFPD